jgi:TFIIF-interacting CTD phosphatase-like protein
MKKKFNIILDLDNTLISGIPLEEFKLDKETKDKTKLFKYHDMEEYYVIFERPGLQKFLDFLFKNFNVSVWSAASKDYVLFIVENIILAKKDRKLDYIFFSYHCNWSKSQSKKIKNLEMLWTDFKLNKQFKANNTFILDDLPEVSEKQPCNSIRIKDFEFNDKGSEKDNELKKIKRRLKNLLKINPKGDICLTQSF